MSNRGSLDGSFDYDGIVTLIVTNATARSVALQPDGKIILAGQSNQNFALVRYTSTGALDNTFGSGGIVIEDMGGDDIAYSVALQQDGKIVVGGKNSYDFAMARYNTNGTLDSGFGSSGKAFCNFYPSQNHNVAYELAIGRDGRIVIAGESDDEVGLARYHGQKLKYYPLQDANHNVTSLLDGSGTWSRVTAEQSGQERFSLMAQPVADENGACLRCAAQTLKNVCAALWFTPPTQSGNMLLGHALADDADNRHEDTAADAAPGNAREDGADLHRTSTRAADAKHSQNLAADATAQDACNRIPDRSKAELLEQRPGDVAADRTADYLNDERYDVHEISFPEAACQRFRPSTLTRTHRQP